VSPFLLVSVASILILASSYFAEFILQLSPCFLCQVQRTLWLAILPVAVLGAFIIRKIAKIGIISILTLNLSVSSYHTLVQLKVIEDRCKSEVEIRNREMFTAILKKEPAQGCSDPWKIGMIPAPVLNGAVSLVLLYFIYRRRSSSCAL